MSELPYSRPEQLWFDGPNYTADAVIIDPEQHKLLLVERRDCGEWALPGGFIDEDETPANAAAREAAEEASFVATDGQLLFRGIVDDPRNTQQSWIETSAYLFAGSAAREATAGDDARQAQWFDLANLPPLYASHQSIVTRALDSLAGHEQLFMPEQAIRHRVEGGHMDYDKYLIETPTALTFLKTHENPTPRPEHLAYLQKEASVMSHLRTQNYPHVPQLSHLQDECSLYMEALPPQYGWQWRAPAHALDAYIQDCLAAFSKLEQEPLPADAYDIAPSFATHYDEGWRILPDNVFETLSPLIAQLHIPTQKVAADLSRNLSELRSLASPSQLPSTFAFCHHDARQSNIAWHADHGTRLIDWAWADIGRVGSDATTLLIDLHKHGYDVQKYRNYINPTHCLTMIGFWLEHASRPVRAEVGDMRTQQLLSALAAYELLL